MANEKQLAILRRGVSVWNKWRRKNPDIIPDLSGANLITEDLVGANLINAKLRGAMFGLADLSGADLSDADLRDANLNGADLKGADLKGADLRMADLRDADLSWVDLRWADLSWATFGGAYLIGADLNEANINGTIFIGALRQLYVEQELPEQLIEVVGVIASELIKDLQKHPEAMYQLRPRQFEEIIAEILASYGWDVQLTPPVKDGGYDIFAISKDIKAKLKSSWIIECKKYAPQNRVGVDIVRALYGVKSNLKVAHALLATTSYFTKGAKDLKASRYDIELKDYKAILEWINEYRPNPNGELYIKDNKLVVPGED
ncbi:MAG: pentapeptide repeat-containing protein [Planctomycetota bacterium]|jgi:HJR/Mrr/RecB family endonuclease